MRKKRELIAPDLTPVIDIVFILLIFFMVTSVFKKDEVILALNLPPLNAVSQPSKEKSITIELTKSDLAIDGKKYSFSSSNELFKTYKKDIKIMIRIDEKVEYARVMKLFDALQQHKLNSFSLVAKEDK